jgi:hypothetical protein
MKKYLFFVALPPYEQGDNFGMLLPVGDSRKLANEISHDCGGIVLKTLIILN